MCVMYDDLYAWNDIYMGKHGYDCNILWIRHLKQMYKFLIKVTVFKLSVSFSSAV